MLGVRFVSCQEVSRAMKPQNITSIENVRFNEMQAIEKMVGLYSSFSRLRIMALTHHDKKEFLRFYKEKSA